MLKQVMIAGLLLAGVTTAANDWVTLYEPLALKEMPYRVMKPLGFDAQKKYPVIVSLHGAGGKGCFRG